jgi:hypothetical protein
VRGRGMGYPGCAGREAAYQIGFNSRVSERFSSQDLRHATVLRPDGRGIFLLSADFPCLRLQLPSAPLYTSRR